MKKRSTQVYCIFAAIIYAFALGFLAYNLITEYINGSKRVQKRFEHTSLTLETNLNKVSSIHSTADQIKDSILSAFGDLNDFAYIELFENNDTIYIYQQNTIENGSKSKMIVNQNSTFSVGNNNYILSANLYTLRPDIVFKNIRIAFFIILAVTILTFIIIFFFNLHEFKTESLNEDEDNEDENEVDEEITNQIIVPSKPLIIIPEEKTEQKEDTISEIPNANQVIVSEFTTTVPEENVAVSETSDISAISPAEEVQSQEPVITEENDTITNESSSETIVEKIEENSEITTERGAENNDEDKTISARNNPESGFGYKEYLMQKISSDLDCAIASESDLSLFMIKLPEIKEEEKDNINKIILEQFQFSENIFEYETDILACIKPGVDVDEAIKFADSLVAEMSSHLDNQTIYIGISSRTIRMLGAERFLKEAKLALEHAQEDPDSPIVAFRADADRFREYIETK